MLDWKIGKNANIICSYNLREKTNGLKFGPKVKILESPKDWWGFLHKKNKKMSEEHFEKLISEPLAPNLKGESYH